MDSNHNLIDDDDYTPDINFITEKLVKDLLSLKTICRRIYFDISDYTYYLKANLENDANKKDDK